MMIKFISERAPLGDGSGRDPANALPRLPSLLIMGCVYIDLDEWKFIFHPDYVPENFPAQKEKGDNE